MNPHDHTLADELHPCVMELARIHHVVDELLQMLGAFGAPHVELEPSNVIIGPDDRVSLRHGSGAPRPPWAAPETLRDGTLTVRSNVYSIGAMVKAMLADRPDLPMDVHNLVGHCTSANPVARPGSFDALKTLFDSLRWGALRRAEGEWHRKFEPKDDRERSFVESLRKVSDDEAMRGVYADWLEENGELERAAFLRQENVAASRDHTSWRAIVARSPVIGCERAECRARWQTLEPIDGVDNRRACGQCALKITYCTSVEDAENHGRRRAPFTLDAAVDETEAKLAFQRALRPLAMRTYNPPPPIPYNPPPPPPPPPQPEVLPLPANPPYPDYRGDSVPDDRNALARFLGWFRRRR